MRLYAYLKFKTSTTMYYKFLSAFITFILSVQLSFAQKNVILQIDHTLNGQPFSMNTSAQNNIGQSFQFSRVDYYISGIKLIHDGSQIISLPDIYLLINGDTALVNLGNHNITVLEGIEFAVGVDSAKNHLDPATYVFGHPLGYQSPSMHWGWSAGYRFAALEGKTGTNMNINFQLHGLWDSYYFPQIIQTSGVINGNNININLEANMAKALSNINIMAGPIEHGNGGADLTMLENFRDEVFSVSTTTGLHEVQSVNLTLSPNPTNGRVRIHTDYKGSKNLHATLYDITGKTIISRMVRNHETIDLSHLQKGFYFINITDKADFTVRRKIILQ